MTAIIDAERDLKWQIEKMIRIHKQELEEGTKEVYRVNKYQDLLDEHAFNLKKIEALLEKTKEL